MTRSEGRLATTTARLVARTEALAPTERLLDHLGADGAVWLNGEQGFVTAGIAAITQPSDAVAVLRTIEHTGSNAGPRAFGALPFSGGGRMIVPASIVERDTDGRVWRTVIEPAPESPAPREPFTPQAPARYTVTQITDAPGWEANVSAILALIDAGAAEKVVLAREVVIDCTAGFDLPTIIETLHRTQPGCIVYADHTFVGASPELLVRRTGRAVTARPMAGTGARAEALAASEKDAREHQLVVDAVLEALAPTCDDTSALAATAVPLTDLAHLATTITARVRDLETSAVDLALALHPTPAVAGTPRATALATIARLEPTPRDLYAGPCGWVDASGDGEFVVALRGAQIQGNRARLHAGAGIVAGSQAEAEWAETQAKLEPMLRAIVRP